MNPLKKALDFYRCSPKLAKFRYTAYYEKLPVAEDVIFVESFHGDGITGNPFWLLNSICHDARLAGFRVFVGANRKYLSEIRRQLDAHGMSRVTAVQKNTKDYLRLLATAKYLITDVTLPWYFIKKDGQLLLNTWHGTPLKGLGRSVLDSPHSIGNMQRNFLMADWLLFPNRYTFDVIREDYMIGPFYEGQYILSGYPRNDILFDAQAAASVRERLGLKDKRIAVYMPTWRDDDYGNGKAYHTEKLSEALKALDASSDGRLVVLAKLHHLAADQIDFSAFTHVRPFPGDYETYEVLAAADCLITDYSSVMFDFADTGRKIVLYAYDREDYRRTRNLYFGVEKLPFVRAESAAALAREAVSPDYAPYERQMADFTAFDGPDASDKLIEYVFFGKPSDGMEIIDGSAYHNDKPHVLLYAGNLNKNGITTALMGLLDNTDTARYNYLLTFYEKNTAPNRKTVGSLGRDIGYLPMPPGKPLTYFEAVCQYLYFHFNLDFGMLRRAVRRISERDARRCFYGIRFHAAIHYTGYEKYMIHLIAAMDTRKVIVVHSNMLKEEQNGRFVHRPSAITAYSTYDRIAVVRPSMRDEMKRYLPTVEDSKIYVSHNLNNIGLIRTRAEEPVVFDEDTWCNKSVEDVNRILSDPDAVRFINVARFSQEKGLDRLVAAFEEFSRSRAHAYLFIVGSFGPLFEDIRAQAEATGLDNIVLIRSLGNPYAVLNRCDVFVLSSHYEGLPMTIMEALILGKPVVCTDITGPREFLTDTGCGLIVADSQEGLADGFRAYDDGRLSSLRPFDAAGFNRQAAEEFYALLQ